MNKILPIGFLAGCLFLAPAAQSATLTLDPTDGALTGLPGTTVGWGFTFINDTDFALITGTAVLHVRQFRFAGWLPPRRSQLWNLHRFCRRAIPRDRPVSGNQPDYATI